MVHLYMHERWPDSYESSVREGKDVAGIEVFLVAGEELCTGMMVRATGGGR